MVLQLGPCHHADLCLVASPTIEHFCRCYEYVPSAWARDAALLPIVPLLTRELLKSAGVS